MALKDLFVLVKLRIVCLSALMAWLGYALFPAGGLRGLLLAVAGTALTVASASLFNMALERDTDARMSRTRHRPVPAGKISAGAVHALAVGCGILGLYLLATLTAAAFAVAALALVSYAFVYTPLKRRTPWAFLAGIGPGAAPPLIGWAAASGHLGGAGLLLFLWLLAWQVPHIMAIYADLKEDYGAAGIPVAAAAWGERLSLALSFPFTLATAALAFLLGREALGPWPQAALLALGAGLLAVHLRVLGTSGLPGRAGFLKKATIWYAAGVTLVFLAGMTLNWPTFLLLTDP